MQHGCTCDSHGEPAAESHKDALEDLLDEVAGLDLSKYTEESAAAFRATLASAQAVFADETLSEEYQQKVDDAVTALKAARDGLAAKADGSGDEMKPETEALRQGRKDRRQLKYDPCNGHPGSGFRSWIDCKKRLTNTNR